MPTTVYVSNWGCHATPGRHGPGRKFTIMALPRAWEQGHGTVALLVPRPEDVKDRHADKMTHEEYVEGYIRLLAFRVRRKGLRPEPGSLVATMFDGRLEPVADGDTLCCACGTDKARRGRCHRTRAAAFLAVSGWTVVLDGEVLGVEAASGILREGLDP